MSDYFAFSYSGISNTTGNAADDGRKLAEECLSKLKVECADKFPPKLLLLFASPAYLERSDAQDLLRGINDTFETLSEMTPLIGSSVAAVFFEKKIHKEGALLVCLASHLIDVEVSCGKNARENPEKAIDELLAHLDFGAPNIDPNPLANKLIITFLPGCRRDATNSKFYPAPKLHDLLYKGANARIMLTGGVSSANNTSRDIDGLQFFQQDVLQDSVVAARLTTGIPIGVGLNDALTGTGDILCVNKVGDNGRTIEGFSDSRLTPQSRLAQIETIGNLMLAKMTSDDERILDLPLKENYSGALGLLRQVKEGDYFEVLKPDSNICDTFTAGIEQSSKRVYIENPVASLLFPCKSYWRFHEQEILDIEAAIAQTEELHKSPCVGGFFDGEIGVDERGRSHLSNGSISYVTFGDEMRERSPLYMGISALAEFGPELFAGFEPTHDSIDKAIDSALKIVNETGFPGAMVSFVMSNLDREEHADRDFIVGQNAIGERFRKVVDFTTIPLRGSDILANVVADGNPVFINDSRTNPKCKQNGTMQSGIISQYILPLRRLDQTVFGTLQVDLGDLSHLSPDGFYKTEKARVLNCFAQVFGAGINRLSSALENTIMLGLDKALKEAMSADRFHEGIQTFVCGLENTFGVEIGHLWLTDIDVKPEELNNRILFLEAGFGSFFESIQRNRIKKQALEESPVFSAYRENGPHIVNDLKNDPVWQEFFRKPKNLETYEKLRNIQSYAAIRFENEEEKVLGVISLGSFKQWFFFRFHQNAMKALADRIHFLVEHLRTKIHHNFLLAVSPKLTERNLDDIQKILNDVTDTFRVALDADFASLYLWDQDREKYVLRAGSRWADNRWIHAASYCNNIDWIGLHTKDNIPLYQPDLYNYYKHRKYEYPGGRYAKHIFGHPLSDVFTVEAIGLPLQIGSKKKDKFGLLTLYHETSKEKASSFVTKNIGLLQEGAYQAAGLINAVLEHRDDIWEKEEEKRRQKVFDAASSNDGDRFFESNVCRAVLESYNASEVAFYTVDSGRKENIFTWIAGYHRTKTRVESTKVSGDSVDHEKILSAALDGGIHKIAIKRNELEISELSNPDSIKTSGLVEEVYIPFSANDKRIAAIVIRWKLSPRDVFSSELQHNSGHLQILGDIMAATYAKHQTKKQVEGGQLGIQIAGIYVFQYAHKFVNAIQSLYRSAQNIHSAKTDNERKLRSKELIDETKVYMEEMDWIFDLGELIQNPQLEPLSLQSLVEECWEKVKKLDRSHTKYENLVDPEIFIQADHRLIREVLTNLMKNAQNAAVKIGRSLRKRHSLKITATLSRDREDVEIIFRDNGRGMTKRQISEAERGFVHARRKYRDLEHKGVGVLISRYLLQVQYGSLEYESVKGKGTDAIVKLPYFEMMRKKNEMEKSS